MKGKTYGIIAKNANYSYFKQSYLHFVYKI